jgi:hypothetical protein
MADRPESKKTENTEAQQSNPVDLSKEKVPSTKRDTTPGSATDGTRELPKVEVREGLEVRTAEDMQRLWKEEPQFTSEKRYYEVKAKQVDGKEHPNGILFSTTESPIVLEKDLVLPGQGANGGDLTLKRGTQLPNGVQFSPNKVEDLGTGADGNKVRELSGGKLITPPEGVTLPDGTVLKSQNLPESEKVLVSRGSLAEKDSFIIQRESVDPETGKPRIDTYFNDAKGFGKRWEAKPGEEGVYFPKPLPADVIQVPPGESFKFKVNYSDELVEAHPGDLIATSPISRGGSEDGQQGFYRISEQDAKETRINLVKHENGESLQDTLKRAKDMADHNGKPFEARFMGIDVTVNPGAKEEDVMKAFQEKWDAKAAERDAKARLDNMPTQLEINKMVGDLPEALGKGDRATIEWLGKFAAKNDNRFVDFDREYVAKALESAGYKSSDAKGDWAAIKATGDPEAIAKYLAGAAISHLRSGMPIHPNVEYAADDALKSIKTNPAETHAGERTGRPAGPKEQPKTVEHTESEHHSTKNGKGGKGLGVIITLGTMVPTVLGWVKPEDNRVKPAAF